MTIFRQIFSFLALSGFCASIPAQAGLISAADYETIRVTYQGTVTKSPIDKVEVQMPDGSIVPYTGPIPDYPFVAGDPITISFDAVVPSRTAIERGLVPTATDGLYQFELGPGITDDNSVIFDFPSLGALGNFTGNGGISQATDNLGKPQNGPGGGLAIVYDANSDSYSINTNFKGGDTDNIVVIEEFQTFTLGFLDTKALDYNFDTNLLTSFQISDRGSGVNVWSGLGSGKGYIRSLSYSGQTNGRRLITNNLLFDGSFNLPFFSPNPTPVPAPPALLLFGIGAGALAWRRRSALRKLFA